MTRPPNVLYLHSHDTGRYVEPYGYPVPTPNIQQLANQGIVFREVFCAVPTCSGSRAALLTGEYGHNNGMLGLAHRGFVLRDYGEHVVHTLREGGYWSAMIGEQHIATRPDVIGYDRVVKVATTRVEAVAPRLRSRRGHERHGRSGVSGRASRAGRAAGTVDAGDRRPAAARSDRAAAGRRAQSSRSGLAE